MSDNINKGNNGEKSAVDTTVDTNSDAVDQAVSESSAYEIIRKRLEQQANDLEAHTKTLNEARLEEFGSSEMSVLGRLRVRTENNCVARDIAQVGDTLIFGYNVFIGLKKETHIEDVFMLYKLVEKDGQYEFETLPVNESFLGEASFVADFNELYTYYKNARLIQLLVKDNKLLASFQIGAQITDIRVFRWSIDNQNKLTYIDNRGEYDIALPSPYDFEWVNTTREDSVNGRHPHINILDTVFVETIGGDLTVKVENNTETGKGIYAEPVDEKNQSIDDAAIAYADLGKFVLLQITPYKEQVTRYLVFNKQNNQVNRIDEIGQSCQQLPEDHGIIFPGGIYLQNGEIKTFAEKTKGMRFKRSIRSPNGEDILYVFYEAEEGRIALFSYNMIEKDLANPLFGHGYSIYDDGKMVIFSSESEEPTRIHPMQVWQTAFTSEEFATSSNTNASFYTNIGNAELVRGISELYSISRTIDKQSASASVYNELSQASERLQSAYYWLDKPELSDVKSTLQKISKTSELVLDEFEKVENIRQRADQAMQEAEQTQADIFSKLLSDSWDKVEEFVDALDSIRKQRGHLLTIKEYRYIDQARIKDMDVALVEKQEALGEETLKFLSEEKSLIPYQQKLDKLDKEAEQAKTRAEIKTVIENYEKMAGDLDLISELVSTLHVEDATIRTRIIESISSIYAKLNQSKARARHKYKDLGSAEAVAQFSVQFKLFSQSIANAVGLATSPDKADEQLNRLLVQLEELEGQFSEHDEFLADIISKRDEVYETFETHKQSLIAERQRRAQNLLDAAERILTSLNRRTQKLSDIDALNTLFASDPLVIKIRDIAEKLREIDDSVKADDIESRLKNSKDQALRSQRDKSEIYEEGGKVIKLGPRHRFSVTTQELDLSILFKDDQLNLHLNGTDYVEPIDNAELNAQKAFWHVDIESESAVLYRAEYLAGLILEKATLKQDNLDLVMLEIAAKDEAELVKIVHDFATPRYKEAYEKGIHDHDASKILQQLLPIQTTSGLLRFPPLERGLAALFWSVTQTQAPQNSWQKRALSAKQLVDVFNHHDASTRLQEEIQQQFNLFLESYPITIDEATAQRSCEYLSQELAQEKINFVSSQYAQKLLDELRRNLQVAKAWKTFESSLEQLNNQHHERWALASSWLTAMLAAQQNKDENSQANQTLAHYVPEAVALLLCESITWKENNTALEITISDLMGDHPRIHKQQLHLSLDDFLSRYHQHRNHVLPGYHDYLSIRSRIMKESAESLRLDEFKPRPLSSFVRNRLINELYLSLIGDNLAKQMGTVGEDKRTDLMGLLMMISPPGYGKTTLMEYVASRLGLIFMKINCPSLGHDVLSLDPEQAPNATAAQELNKLNLALEMSNNVMLYLDDIQHTHPEFLQKFISLSDGTRRVDGIWKGKTKTYDMRGKRFCIIMAGNPYTESGDVFQIPDMLANRADIYNLGDMLGDHEEAFSLSYIENSLTANPVLAPLATREMSDTYLLIDMAKGKQVASTDLKHNYSGAELNEIVEVLKKMFVIQEVILKVNQQYIASAAQNDAYRKEPPFKLQGSYRNMNKMAEKLSAVMNEEEMMQMIEDHYLGEAQLLTNGAEENLLKLAELRGNMTKEQKARWTAIKKDFMKNKMTGNEEATIGLDISEKLGFLVDNIEAVNQSLKQNDSSEKLVTQLSDISSTLKSSLQAMQQASEKSAENDTADTELKADKASILLATSLSNMSHSIENVQKSLAEPKATDTLLAESLKALSENLSNKNSSQKTTSEEIVVQLSKIVEGMTAMNRELEEVSEASQEKAKWFSRLTRKEKEKEKGL
ncbi:DNA repair ATPase [Cocleimonas flava]|uniref:ATPase family protein associated with various cellular activities (AAA) n=1 Tax=Cocleimonas flava TaxID=634765 RepID=A0A4R1F523_9GAMM|nr:DNA repair ATPase [Cocleimonas flava]TCJ88480.1 ATPase family protein associated with various cellular activities (AAA) [Cocleimonas flava]